MPGIPVPLPSFHQQLCIGLISLGIILGVTGCHQPESPVDTRPKVEVLSISPDTLYSFRDTLLVEISYEDTDGDLGAYDPDEKSLWIKDSRLADADLFHVKPLNPPETAVHIRGSLQIEFPNMFLISADSMEQAFFRIKIRDRSGQWSEEAVSAPIVIMR